MASYIGQTALNALWNKLIAVLSSKADRASVYSKAEVDYKLATTYGTSGSGGGGDTSDCVHLTGTETISGIKTFTGTGNVFYDQGLKIKSSNTTAYYATIRNNASASKTIYLPYSTGTTHYIVSRTSTSLISGQLTAWDGTAGILKNSGYTVATSVSSSTSTIPTSAAVKTYVDSNSGGTEWYTIHAYKVTDNNGPAAVLEGYYNLNLSSSGGYYYYLMRFHTAHGAKSWKIPYLGYYTNAADHWVLNKCRWNISTTSSITRFWGQAYTVANVFPRHNGKYTGGGYTHTFGCAIFKEESSGYITRVSNIAAFTMDRAGNLKISANKV